MAIRITMLKLRRGPAENVNQELQWLGTSLGLFNTRDKDSSCFRVFIMLVRNAPQGRALISDEIAERLNLTRGTVVHHLHKMMDAGIVIHEKDGYLLREHRLQLLMDRMQRDVQEMFLELQVVAKEIDEKLG